MARGVSAFSAIASPVRGLAVLARPWGAPHREFAHFPHFPLVIRQSGVGARQPTPEFWRTIVRQNFLLQTERLPGPCQTNLCSPDALHEADP
jgi:hypothetical protein